MAQRDIKEQKSSADMREFCFNSMTLVPTLWLGGVTDPWVGGTDTLENSQNPVLFPKVSLVPFWDLPALAKPLENWKGRFWNEGADTVIWTFFNQRTCGIWVPSTGGSSGQ